MKFLCSLVFLILFSASSAVYAEDVVGRVRGVYFEAARHVLVDQRMQRAPASARLWADVELGTTIEPDRRRVLVQVPQELRAAPGDVVAVQLEDLQPSRLAANQIPMLRVSRITEVRSRAFAGLGTSAD